MNENEKAEVKQLSKQVCLNCGKNCIIWDNFCSNCGTQFLANGKQRIQLKQLLKQIVCA